MNDIIKIVLPFILGGIGVVCADLYADFRNVGTTEKQLDYYKDYNIVLDSVLKENARLEKIHNQKERATLLTIKQLIANNEELTVKALEIAEDSIVTITPYQSDSIRNILITQ